jgi:alkylated DNA repair protein (DNA oxidative demethylase)
MATADQPDLFAEPELPEPTAEDLVPGARLLRGFARAEAAALLAAIDDIALLSPFRRMVTPRGFALSVAMTNCGRFGWVTDRSGYRYDNVDPESGTPWPEMPPLFTTLARRAAEEAGFRA